MRFRRTLARNQLRHRHVFERGEFGKEVMKLIDIAYGRAAQLGTAAIAQLAGGNADDLDLASLRTLQQA